MKKTNSSPTNKNNGGVNFLLLVIQVVKKYF